MKSNSFDKQKRLFVFAILVVIVLSSVIQGYTAINYPDRNHPYYAANYAVASPELVEAITVVSYNIYFAEKIDEAISDLKEIQSQQGLDILLLQEMDEVGVEKIARELQMNYVYFPAAIEPTYDMNFGNAILTRWPIIDSQKLILPHKSLSNRMSRTATRATIRIQDADILVYSIHTESIFTLPRFREEQYGTVLDDIGTEARLVIVGGDFNTFSESAVKKIEQDYREAGLSRASEGGGNTVIKLGIGLISDHIFAKGLVVDETGTWTEATASDHLPLWVTLRLE